MPNSSQAFCLLLDPDIETVLPTISDPLAGRYLELSQREDFINQRGKLSRPQNGYQSIQLESVRCGSHSSLLMSFAPGMRVTVNGLPAPCITVLNPGDVLGIEDHILQVSLLNRPYIGPPDESHLAAKCGYCRVPIQDEAGMRVYVCPNCQLPTHYHGEEIPVEKRLECAKLASHCGHCQADIVESEGFTHVPTF